MSLFNQWGDKVKASEASAETYSAFWNAYLPKEVYNYDYILQNKVNILEGKISDLAEAFNMDSVTFVGFLDGINTSLKTPLELENLESESTVSAEIDFEKLYHNMLVAGAKWLYTLDSWENMLSKDTRKHIKKAYDNTRIVRNDNKVGRNEPCPCGSGKKYKKCCGK